MAGRRGAAATAGSEAARQQRLDGHALEFMAGGLSALVVMVAWLLMRAVLPA